MATDRDIQQARAAMDATDALMRLYQLKEAEAVSAEEYEKLKAAIMKAT